MVIHGDKEKHPQQLSGGVFIVIEQNLPRIKQRHLVKVNKKHSLFGRALNSSTGAVRDKGLAQRASRLCVKRLGSMDTLHNNKQ